MSRASFLNKLQCEAIYADNKPTLVIAGAGTGKTKVLVNRIVKLINEDGISPSRILPLTFTNKSKDEINTRIFNHEEIKDILEEFTNTKKSIASTFDSVFLKIFQGDYLETHPKLKKKPKPTNPDILESIFRYKLQRLPIKKIDGDWVDHGSALNAIHRLKTYSKSVDIDEQHPKLKDESEILGITCENLLLLFREYQEELHKRGWFDFTDIAIHAHNLLESCLHVREKWRNRYDAILIDEFQDTNQLQLDILKLLFDEKSNIFCVGDSDQSIYSFRGSIPSIFIDFMDYFNVQEPIKLEENYRSTQNILDAANHLISFNCDDEKLRKVLKAYDLKNIGEKSQCHIFQAWWDEAQFVADEIKRIYKENL